MTFHDAYETVINLFALIGGTLGWYTVAATSLREKRRALERDLLSKPVTFTYKGDTLYIVPPEKEHLATRSVSEGLFEEGPRFRSLRSLK